MVKNKVKMVQSGTYGLFLITVKTNFNNRIRREYKNIVRTRTISQKKKQVEGRIKKIKWVTDNL